MQNENIVWYIPVETSYLVTFTLYMSCSYTGIA